MPYNEQFGPHIGPADCGCAWAKNRFGPSNCALVTLQKHDACDLLVKIGIVWVSFDMLNLSIWESNREL